MKKSYLHTIQQIIIKENFEFIFIESNSNYPIDRLVVLLGLDDKQREQKLEISQFPHTFDLSETTSDISSLNRFQLKLTFPFIANDLIHNDLSSLLHFINHATSFPGFEFDALSGEISFRYVLITSDENIKTALIKDLLQCIQLNLKLYSILIESVASGQATFDQILTDILNKFKN